MIAVPASERGTARDGLMYQTQGSRPTSAARTLMCVMVAGPCSRPAEVSLSKIALALVSRGDCGLENGMGGRKSRRYQLSL